MTETGSSPDENNPSRLMTAREFLGPETVELLYDPVGSLAADERRAIALAHRIPGTRMNWRSDGQLEAPIYIWERLYGTD